jgi:beta-ring hydroxylase
MRLGLPVIKKERAVLPTRSSWQLARKPRSLVLAAHQPNDDKSRGFGGRKYGENLEERIASGEFDDSSSTKEKLTRPLRKLLAKDVFGPGRALAYQLAQVAKRWRRAAAERMPEARGDIREIVGQPVFVPLYKLFLIYGKVFRLSFGPKTFVIVSDAELARQVLLTNASNYSKGLLSEILDFVMGKGLIPADGEVWRVRRRAIVPALHKKYITAMVSMFGDCAIHGSKMLQTASNEGKPVEMENFFSRLALDIIGKAVFNYDFDSLTTDDPVIQAVYTTLREAEYRSTYPIPYWNFAPLRAVVPRQRQCDAALKVISNTLDELIAKCKKLVEEEDEEFVEEFLSRADPSLLHFLIASGEEITSKQLRDDLMTLLIAGHETTAAVLTWTFHCIVDRPDVLEKLQNEVDTVLGDRKPTVEDMRALRYCTRVINEAMRLYPQPPVLIRRALQDDVLDGFRVPAGSDLFISVWNIHHNPAYWPEPDQFNPERFGPLDRPTPNEVTEDFRYLPFGGGKRKCIGDQFALFESIVALAMLIRRFEFSRPADAPEVGMTTGATIHTTQGLWLNMTPRNLKSNERNHDSQPLYKVGQAALAMAFEDSQAFGSKPVIP